MPIIYHIIPRTDWEAAQQNGAYRPPSLKSEGFIHCSTDQQAAPVANAFYSGQEGLVLLIIDTEQLSATLQWDPPAHPAPEKTPAALSGKFPHIYGTLNLDAVVDVLNFSPDEDGIFTFPKI